MDELKPLEQALAQTEQRVEALRAARVAPVQQALREVEQQLAETEAATRALETASKRLPGLLGKWFWWLAGPLASLVVIQNRHAPSALGWSAAAFVAAYLLGSWLAGRSR